MKKRKLHTLETVSELRTRSRFRAAYERNRADSSALNDVFIQRGRGHWRAAEVARAAAEGDADSIYELALCDEASALRYRAESFFGQPGYMI